MKPVTGPFTRTFEDPKPQGPKKFYFTRTSYRQKRPYNLRLPFFYDAARIRNELNRDVSYSSGGHPYWHEDANMQKTYNHAYRAFISKMKADQASWLVTLSERQKTFDMISTRALQLAAGIKAARSGNLRALRKAWGKHSGLRRRLSATGSHVLEYSFGWAPLVGDIMTGVNALHNGIPPNVCRGRYEFVESMTQKTKPSWYLTRRLHRTIKREVQIIADVDIDSPFLAMLNQLGLINPLTVLYERTPWSFVANYFVNLDDWLGGFSDFVGFNVSNQAVTRYSTAVSIHSGRYSSELRGLPYYLEAFTVEQVRVSRTVGAIPQPTLSGRLPWRLSVQRASTSVALLLQRLKS